MSIFGVVVVDFCCWFLCCFCWCCCWLHLLVASVVDGSVLFDILFANKIVDFQFFYGIFISWLQILPHKGDFHVTRIKFPDQILKLCGLRHTEKVLDSRFLIRCTFWIDIKVLMSFVILAWNCKKFFIILSPGHLGEDGSIQENNRKVGKIMNVNSDFMKVITELRVVATVTTGGRVKFVQIV